MNKLEKLLSRVDELCCFVKGLREKIETLEGDKTSADGIEKNKSEIEKLKTSLDSYSNDLGELKSTLKNLQRDVSANDDKLSKIDTIDKKLKGLQSKIDGIPCLETLCSELESLDEFRQNQVVKNQELSERALATENSITQIKETLRESPNNQALENLRTLIQEDKQTLSELKSKDAEIEERLSGVPTNTNLEELSKKVSKNAEDVKTLNPLIEKVSNNESEISRLKEREDYTTEKAVSDIEGSDDFKQRLKAVLIEDTAFGNNF